MTAALPVETEAKAFAVTIEPTASAETCRAKSAARTELRGDRGATVHKLTCAWSFGCHHDLSTPKRRELHGDGVVGVARDIPAGMISGVRKQGVSARNIFLGAIGIDLVLNLVVFFGNGQDARTVNGAVRHTQLRGDNAQLVPSKIDQIKKQDEAEQYQRDAADESLRIALRAMLSISHKD